MRINVAWCAYGGDYSNRLLVNVCVSNVGHHRLIVAKTVNAEGLAHAAVHRHFGYYAIPRRLISSRQRRFEMGEPGLLVLSGRERLLHGNLLEADALMRLELPDEVHVGRDYGAKHEIAAA